jgi:hypothetical protein
MVTKGVIMDNGMARVRTYLQLVVLTLLVTFLAACTSTGLDFVPGLAASRYVASHPHLDRQTAYAVLRGDVIAGMTPEAVRAAGGWPVLRTRYADTEIESWLVRTSTLQLGHYRSHNAAMLRIVFERGRVTDVQPIN